MVARARRSIRFLRFDVMKSHPVWKDIAHAMFNLKEFIYIP
jgi:hypothetical protein